MRLPEILIAVVALTGLVGYFAFSAEAQQAAREGVRWEVEQTSPDGRQTQVWQVYPSGRRVRVSENQDTYQRWLKAGNTPVTLPYTPPPPTPVDTRTEAERAADEWARERDLGRVVYDLLQRVEALEAGPGTRTGGQGR